MKLSQLLLIIIFIAIGYWGLKYKFQVLERNEIEREIQMLLQQKQDDTISVAMSNVATLATYIETNFTKCNMSEMELQQVLDTIQDWAYTFNIDYTLILGQVAHESAWNKYALGKAGEVGLFQVKPEACKDVGIKFEDARDNVFKNVEAGIKYYQLTSMRNLSAYNQGLTAHKKNGTNSYPLKVFAQKKKFDNLLKIN